MKHWLVVLISLLSISCASTYKKVEVSSVPSFQTVLKEEPVETGVALTTQTTLKYAVKSDAEREKVADYINVYAKAVRTITGSPTPEELKAELDLWIPKTVRENHPIITAASVSLIVSKYQKYYPSLKGKYQKTNEWLNKMATGLEYGSAAYISK